MFGGNIQKIIITLVIIAGLGILAYNIFVNKQPAILITILDTNNTETTGEDILVLAEKLKVISIDPSLFSSTLFSNLRDSSVIIVPESQGRVNPFDLIGAN